MLNLTRRPALVGGHINGRAERHGAEWVPACDLTLKGLMLDSAELNAIVGDPDMHTSLFVKGEDGFVNPAPGFARLNGPLAFDLDFEGACVRLYVGPEADLVELQPCDVGQLRMSPKAGGQTELTLQVQCTPPEATIARLFGFMHRDCAVEISDGKQVEARSGQESLPMPTAGSEGDAKPKGKRGRKPAAQAA